jgi:AraC-like DNA-binding protein
MGDKHQILIKRPHGLLLYRTAKSTPGNLREDPSYKLLFGCQGVTRYQVQRKSLHLYEQQFLVINPLTFYQQIRYDQEKILVEINPSLMNDVSESIGGPLHRDLFFALQLQKHPQISQWVRFTKDFADLHSFTFTEDGAETSELAIFLDHALVQLVILLVRLGIHHMSKDLPLPRGKTISSLINTAILAMKEGFADSWTLDQMAAATGLGKYQFAHLFKQEIGISPYSWLQLYRLIRSLDPLLRTNHSVLEIAMSCGFSSVRTYNQLFLRTYGISPATFRAKYR